MSDAIQQRAAYFDCIAALDGSSEALAPAELPSSASPASFAPPRWSHVMIDAVVQRRNSVGLGLGGFPAENPKTPLSVAEHDGPIQGDHLNQNQSLSSKGSGRL